MGNTFDDGLQEAIHEEAPPPALAKPTSLSKRERSLRFIERRAAGEV